MRKICPKIFRAREKYKHQSERLQCGFVPHGIGGLNRLGEARSGEFETGAAFKDPVARVMLLKASSSSALSFLRWSSL